MIEEFFSGGISSILIVLATGFFVAAAYLHAQKQGGASVETPETKQGEQIPQNVSRVVTTIKHERQTEVDLGVWSGLKFGFGFGLGLLLLAVLLALPMGIIVLNMLAEMMKSFRI